MFLSIITAIPSIATTFSTDPFAFSPSFNPLEAFPISTEPAARDSSPAPEPVYSTVTVTPGFASIKLSDIASHNFSIEVDPANVIFPFKSPFSVPSDPHPVNATASKHTAVIAANNFFFIIKTSSFHCLFSCGALFVVTHLAYLCFVKFIIIHK